MEHPSVFESMKKISSSGTEYWWARDLSEVLGYGRYTEFVPVIHKAIRACEESGNDPHDFFKQVERVVKYNNGAKRKLDDVGLARYACYLCIQNGDPSKPVVALGMTYFAQQTRESEIRKVIEDDRKRIEIREEIKVHNKKLVAAAKTCGVDSSFDFAIFQNHGYKGLYKLDAKEIAEKKGLREGEAILDNMGSTELAANLFRATQTEEKLKRDTIRGKDNANKTHFEVGRKIRNTIVELGGTLPEELPNPGPIKDAKKRLKEAEKSE
ncbi:MAG: DNA damage-inducible protein D [bacterium]|nr:DNA damage-inducible protein D [bacterium]